MLSAQKRNRKGQVYIEVICGLFILIPIALFAVDLIVLVLGNSANDSLAKNCARAAANEQDANKAKEAAQQVINDFKLSQFIEKVELDTSKLVYDEKENVTIETMLTVHIPITLPGTQPSVTFRASATEPVVGVSAAPL